MSRYRVWLRRACGTVGCERDATCEVFDEEHNRIDQYCTDCSERVLTAGEK